MPADEALIHIRLQDAYLCQTCDHIGNRGTACVCCGDEHGLQSLSSVLNRSDNRTIIEGSECQIPALSSATTK